MKLLLFIFLLVSTINAQNFRLSFGYNYNDVSFQDYSYSSDFEEFNSEQESTENIHNLHLALTYAVLEKLDIGFVGQVSLRSVTYDFSNTNPPLGKDWTFTYLGLGLGIDLNYQFHSSENVEFHLNTRNIWSAFGANSVSKGIIEIEPASTFRFSSSLGISANYILGEYFSLKLGSNFLTYAIEQYDSNTLLHTTREILDFDIRNFSFDLVFRF